MRTIQVYYPDPVTGVLTMKFKNDAVSETTGVRALLQAVTFYLLTDPGSNVFNTTIGTVMGNRNSLTRASVSPTQLRILVIDAVEKAQAAIMAEQALGRQNGIKLTPDETLVKLELSDIYQGDDPSSIFVEILVYTEGNKTYFLTV